MNDSLTLAPVKRPSKAVLECFRPEFLHWLAPLEEGQILSVLSATAGMTEDGLAPAVRQTFKPLASSATLRFTRHLLEHWIAANGEPKLRWLLRFLPDYGNDECAQRLYEAINQWHKSRRPRAVEALRALARMNTPYALALVREVLTRRPSMDSLYDGAWSALREAAASRRISHAELLDELMPDFGLSNGLSLNTGAHCYSVSLGAQLQLLVHDENGKRYKSLPKAKAGDDAAQWEVAQQQYKTIGSALKKLSQSYAQHLQHSLWCGRRWSVQRWQQLFCQHPVLSQLAHSLIWLAWDRLGQRMDSLRITEDGSLLNRDEQLVCLPDNAQLSLWHPVHALPGELDGWSAHLADYELQPPFDQLNQPTWSLEMGDSDGQCLTRIQGLEVSQGKAQTLLNRWGYVQGMVTDGPNIENHHLDLPGYYVVLDNSGWPPFFADTQVILEGVYVKSLQDGKTLAPEQLPQNCALPC